MTWQPQPNQRLATYGLIAFSIAVLFMASSLLRPAHSQDADTAGPSGEVAPDSETPTAGEENPAKNIKGINILELLVSGGWFMLPIAAMSLLVVTFAVERGIGLRRSRVLPPELVDKLSALGAKFDPREAYRICQQSPSSASTVIRAMLLKVGRPQSEVEHTVNETSEREAERLYANVRWLNLASAVTPLLGLLGTVWGMIRAFHDTTQLTAGQNKADYLAEGIYVALVTTLGGLAVAIPAAIFAHYFEGRIQALFHEIDELLFNLVPHLERYEGRVRFSAVSPDSGESEEEEGSREVAHS